MGRRKKSLLWSSTRSIRDAETGTSLEVVTSSLHSVREFHNPYYMVFLDYTFVFKHLRSMKDLLLLDRIMHGCDYNTNLFCLTPMRRIELCKALGVDKYTLSRALGRLRGCGIIGGVRGDYMVNPLLYWKGEIRERKLLLDKDDWAEVYGFDLRLLYSVDGGGEDDSGEVDYVKRFEELGGEVVIG